MPKAHQRPERPKARERDGAVVCNAKHGNGRCPKLIATEKGELICPNGHKHLLMDVIEAAIQRPDVGQELYYNLWPSFESLKPLIRRFASAEFLKAEGSMKNWLVCERNAGFLTWIIRCADYVDRPSANMLRDAWERYLAKHYPIIGQWLEKKKDEGSASYLLARENLLRSYGRWSEFDPHRPLAFYEAITRAAKELGHPHAVLYEHSLKEAARIMEQGSMFYDPPLYFIEASTDPEPEREFSFWLVIDPWKEVSINSYHDRWISLRHCPHGPVRFYASDKVKAEIMSRLDNHREGYHSLSPDERSTHRYVFGRAGEDAIWTEPALNTTDPVAILDLMQQLQAAIGGGLKDELKKD
ncbi:MAG TPA: hypothetical protein VFQ60_03630 [Patescibacteria group bacterium]|nr:hypothetical protein [Patescibacteria group bacterium]